MFCAATLAFAVGVQRHGALEAQVWGVLVLVATVAELSVGIALLLALFRRRKSLDMDSWERLKW
jgi:NADH:ubiquinone oxidoreductase subunit K